VVDGSGDRSASRGGWAYRFIAGLAVLFVRSLRWKVTVIGLENLPRTGGAVLTWNHTSHIDFLLAAWGLRRVKRLPRFLAKRELWSSWLSRRIVNAVGAVPVDRTSGPGRARSFDAAVEALRDGAVVAVAPEGTISSSFEPLPFRSGAARMAQQAGVPIVPCATWGSHRLVTYGHPFSPRRAWRIPVTVRYGPPIHLAPDEDVREATERLRRATVAMVHDIQERYPDGTPAGAWWVPARLGGGAPSPEPDHETSVTEPGPDTDPPFTPLEPGPPARAADHAEAGIEPDRSEGSDEGPRGEVG
jgi:1-acyl-sn-glycerol-3-phosphate acyltransferase